MKFTTNNTPFRVNLHIFVFSLDTYICFLIPAAGLAFGTMEKVCVMLISSAGLEFRKHAFSLI